jgi:hypothetical protein
VKADVGAPVGTPVVKTGAGEFLRLPPITAKIGGAAEYVVIPAGALLASLVLFGIFVALFGKNPLDLYFYMYQGAFGTWFSWQNTLTRAAPLILTALCTALPAQLGMVIIGGEGALLIGALCATSAAAAYGSCSPARCGNIAASTKQSQVCCWSTSRSRFSTFWSKVRCATRPA